MVLRQFKKSILQMFCPFKHLFSFVHMLQLTGVTHVLFNILPRVMSSDRSVRCFYETCTAIKNWFTGFIAIVCQLTRFYVIFLVAVQYANAKYHCQSVVITQCTDKCLSWKVV